ncbi:hypothetical protein ACFY2W_23695 [Streptomyces sp. NPDC001262]|uniref:hypothetical protein n=1 Tax=Streptomyces sp. NPDC001262 TaxID=3364552 RepID=UPI0036D12BC6
MDTKQAHPRDLAVLRAAFETGSAEPALGWEPVHGTGSSCPSRTGRRTPARSTDTHRSGRKFVDPRQVEYR